MIKYFVGLSFFFVFCTLNAQENAVNSKLIGKWFFSQIEMGDLKREVPEEKLKESWMLFEADGNVEIVSYGKKSPEKWKYGKDNKNLIITDNGKFIDFVIQNLTTEELVLSKKEKGMEITFKLKK